MSAAVWPPISREQLIKEEEESLVLSGQSLLAQRHWLIDYFVGS